jgi:hypothetical protein
MPTLAEVVNHPRFAKLPEGSKANVIRRLIGEKEALIYENSAGRGDTIGPGSGEANTPEARAKSETEDSRQTETPKIPLTNIPIDAETRKEAPAVGGAIASLPLAAMGPAGAFAATGAATGAIPGWAAPIVGALGAAAPLGVAAVGKEAKSIGGALIGSGLLGTAGKYIGGTPGAVVGGLGGALLGGRAGHSGLLKTMSELPAYGKYATIAKIIGKLFGSESAVAPEEAAIIQALQKQYPGISAEQAGNIARANLKPTVPASGVATPSAPKPPATPQDPAKMAALRSRWDAELAEAKARMNPPKSIATINPNQSTTSGIPARAEIPSVSAKVSSAETAPAKAQSSSTGTPQKASIPRVTVKAGSEESASSLADEIPDVTPKTATPKKAASPKQTTPSKKQAAPAKPSKVQKDAELDEIPDATPPAEKPAAEKSTPAEKPTPPEKAPQKPVKKSAPNLQKPEKTAEVTASPKAEAQKAPANSSELPDETKKILRSLRYKKDFKQVSDSDVEKALKSLGDSEASARKYFESVPSKAKAAVAPAPAGDLTSQLKASIKATKEPSSGKSGSVRESAQKVFAPSTDKGALADGFTAETAKDAAKMTFKKGVQFERKDADSMEAWFNYKTALTKLGKRAKFDERD